MRSNEKGAAPSAPEPEDRDGLDESIVNVHDQPSHVKSCADVLLRMLIPCAPRSAQQLARFAGSRDDS
jgi:hypothetical protein